MTELTREYLIKECGYVNARQLADKSWIAMERLVAGEVRICLGLDRGGWSEAYDYRNVEEGFIAFANWTPAGPPEYPPWVAWRGPGGEKKKGPAWPEGGVW